MIRKILGFIAVVLLGLYAFLSWCYSGTVARVEVEEKLVALTYDDGPNPPYTRQMLDLLEDKGVRATFFLKGANVEAYPESAVAVVRAGHELGNHSWYHRSMLSWSKADMLVEVRRTGDVIEQVAGVRPMLFRPPYGAQGPGLKRALDELGMPSVLASSFGSEWEVFEARAVADKVLGSIAPGGIILLHDGHGDVDDPGAQDSRAHVVEATGIVIDTLRGQGYRFVTAGELLAMASSGRD